MLKLPKWLLLELSREPKLTKDTLCEVACRHSGQVFTGAHYHCLLIPDLPVVVKIPRARACCWNPSFGRANIQKDLQLFRKLRKRSKVHFPETKQMKIKNQPVMVQERFEIDSVLYDAMNQRITRLAAKFNVWDIHDQNVGFRREKGKRPQPVFFDVSVCDD